MAGFQPRRDYSQSMTWRVNGELEDMPFISGRRPKVLAARKGMQAKW
jgi:hypothetical protein